ncbi:hypothetical protein EG68_01916, partial [Paragonimus skrjabini miyazakii]
NSFQHYKSWRPWYSEVIHFCYHLFLRVLESSNSMATTLIGTPYYMSPELFANKPYNHKSDIWALGCVLYEMATLKHAFSAGNFSALSYKIMSGEIPEMPNQYSSEVMELLRMMLHQNPEKRPSARRILRNSFIRKHIILFLESTKDRQVRLIFRYGLFLRKSLA